MTLPERRRETKENSLDRRRISETSRRRLAETIHYGETDAALRELFHILTGEFVADVPPVRDVVGTVTLGADVSIGENERLVLDVTVGSESQIVYVDGDGEDTYRFRERGAGTYDVSVAAVKFLKYDPDTLERTKYEIDSASRTLAANSVAVDPETVELGAVVDAPLVTVDSYTVGAEITEDSA